MNRTSAGLLMALAAILSGCGGNGGGDGGNPAPTATAGADQTVDEQTQVTLVGSGQDSNGTVQSFLWTQLSGNAVPLSGATATTATFTAPALSATDTLTFQLLVTDNQSASGTDTVQVTVNPVAGMNNPPLANPGGDQTVAELSGVTLSGAASTDADGSIQAYQWQQISGTGVVLSNAGAVTATFTAPDIVGAEDLVFQLMVTDNEGATAAANVTVTVVDNLLVTISGRVTFDLVPVGGGMGGVFLDYNNTQARPARGVTVQLVEGVAVIDSAVTDVNGDYSLTGTGNTNVFVRARAEMLQGAPGWDVRVVDNTQGNALYVMDGAPFNTGGANIVENLHADSGWTGGGYGAARVAAPFAILDLAYAAMQLVVTADATVNFPALVVHWSPLNRVGAGGIPNTVTGELGSSFFRSGPSGGIFLLGDENGDTEEYDRHVIAHEWGHYFEHNFSRSDSIGGPHTLDDQLDMRVAFGEGFGNALSAMITGSVVYTDTGGAQQSSGFNFSIEGTALSRPGWFNEFSIQEILYDLFDPANDDAIQLGFTPLYDVFINEQRNTLALTSIFPFIDALKTNLPGSAAAIDGLLGAHSIDPIVDAFGTTETNSGFPANADVLPVYSNLTVNGGSLNVCSTDDFTGAFTGSTNKLGSRRYLRFTAAATASYTITVTTTSAPAGESTDPDMLLHQMGPIAIFDAEPTLACTPADLASCLETTSSVGLNAGDYVVEIYEWTNTNADDDPVAPPIGRACFDVEVTSP